MLEPARPGFVPEAAPLRFALLAEGRVYVGGTDALMTGQLDKREQADLDRRVDLVRKLAAPPSVAFGPGERRYRLRLGKGQRLDVVASGDPAAAPAALQPLARLVADLAAFDHPSLRPLAPASYLVAAVEQALPGGCRPWRLATPLGELLGAARTLAAEQVPSGWPSGAVAASVCGADGRRYAVTFRPLAPGERP